MGQFHPHGDSSIYGAMVRLAQDWVMRYPLIDFHGNMGNIDGDGPAAARYTEARLAKISEDGLLSSLKKNSVPFRPNYDESTVEPVTLPAIFPNLLCNPNMGIGVAMACNWAPHNLTEVAQAIYDYLDGKEPMLPGPDFPTGGIIINKDAIPGIMRTGHGSVKVRARYKVEKNNIVFTEIPYGETTEGLLQELAKVVDEEKKIDGISHIRNESNKKGIRIVIECEKGITPDAIAQKIFAETSFQTSFSYNQVALIDKVPTEMNLLKCCQVYVKHNVECIVRETEFELQKLKDRKHIIDGLLKALEDIDNIISLIKSSHSAKTATIELMEKYNFSMEQAKAIVDMKLGKLAGLEKIEIQQEADELVAKINALQTLLSSEENLEQEVRDRLAAIVKKYGDARRTELAQIEVTKEEKEIETVIPEDCVVIMSNNGDIKRVAASSFKVQRRNGKGVKSEDAILDMISTNTIDNLMIFTNKGKMFRLLVDNVPAGTNASKGVNINSLVKMDLDEKAIAITSHFRKSPAEYIVFITKQGLFKKSKIEEYTSVKKTTGIQAIKLKEDDSIANITFCNEEEFILITKLGLAIRFETAEISAIGRVTSGVKSVKLSENDEVLIGLPIHKTTDSLGIFTKNGCGKKVSLEEFPVQGRGGKGVKVIKDIHSCGEVVGAAMLSDEDNIIINGLPNSICISAKDIPSLSRDTIGNTLIKGSIIKGVVKI
jgi:DNA gyrase subunit A